MVGVVNQGQARAGDEAGEESGTKHNLSKACSLSSLGQKDNCLRFLGNMHFRLFIDKIYVMFRSFIFSFVIVRRFLLEFKFDSS